MPGRTSAGSPDSPAVPERGAGPRRRLPQPYGRRRAMDGPTRAWRTVGAGASGGWAPPRRTATTTGSARRRSSSSSGPHGSGRRGRGRWRSPRWAPRRCSASSPDHRRGPQTDHRLRDVYACAAGRRLRRLAVAGAAAHLRQRGARRGDDRGRCRARGDPKLWQRGLDLLGWLLDARDRGWPPLTHAGRRRAARATPGPASTSSRSRWPRWPMPARAPPRSTASARWPDGVRAAAALVRRATTTSDSACGIRQTGGGFDGLQAHGVNLTRAPSRPWP